MGVFQYIQLEHPTVFVASLFGWKIEAPRFAICENYELNTTMKSIFERLSYPFFGLSWLLDFDKALR